MQFAPDALGIFCNAVERIRPSRAPDLRLYRLSWPFPSDRHGDVSPGQRLARFD